MTPPIVIIGAGAAGLSASYELKKRGIGSVILEQADEAGHSWQEMPTRLRLVSPWPSNHLAGERKLRRVSTSYRMPAREYAQYLAEFARRHALEIRHGTRVISVEREHGGFGVRTGAETLHASHVINATGYWSNPYVPPIPGLDRTRIPVLHWARYKDATNLRGILGAIERPRGLIVGQRLSAGQALAELHEAGFELTLSLRSPLELGPPAWLEAIAFPNTPWIDRLKKLAQGAQAKPYNVRMESGPSRLVREGKIRIAEGIREVSEHEVRFDGGTSAPFDLILLATGFSPALSHLGELVEVDPKSLHPVLEGFESARCPGLFFVGVDRLADFRSRFLRGIRDDASALAARIESMVKSETR